MGPETKRRPPDFLTSTVGIGEMADVLWPPLQLTELSTAPNSDCLDDGVGQRCGPERLIVNKWTWG